MLIKFDKIKYLEDFYNLTKQRENSQNPDQIRLYVEIDHDEMIRIAEKLALNN